MNAAWQPQHHIQQQTRTLSEYQRNLRKIRWKPSLFQDQFWGWTMLHSTQIRNSCGCSLISRDYWFFETFRHWEMKHFWTCLGADVAVGNAECLANKYIRFQYVNTIILMQQKKEQNYRNSCLSEEKNISCVVLAASIESSLDTHHYTHKHHHTHITPSHHHTHDLKEMGVWRKSVKHEGRAKRVTKVRWSITRGDEITQGYHGRKKGRHYDHKAYHLLALLPKRWKRHRDAQATKWYMYRKCKTTSQQRNIKR